MVDRRGTFVRTRGGRHPVTGDGMFHVARRVGKAAGKAGVQFAEGCDQPVEAALLNDDAARDETRRGMRQECILERFAPAISF